MSEIVNSNPQNANPHKGVNTRSTFPLQYHAFDTFRFGEYHPHFVMEGVAKDRISFRSSHDLRSYTLGAPLMEDISMKKDYFNVPMTAILPLNWDKFFANPVKGQDVPSDCGPSLAGFYEKYNTLMGALTTRFIAIIPLSSITDTQVATALLRYIALGEYVFSAGSLMSSLNVHCHQYFSYLKDGDLRNFDYLVDQLVDVLNLVQYMTVTDSNGRNIRCWIGNDPRRFSTRDLLQLFRTDPASSVTSITYVTGQTATVFKSAVTQALPVSSDFILSNVVKPFNLSRLAAYQLVVSQFYTNDSIDFVFDANRYRQLMWYYFTNASSSVVRYFTVNGLQYDYDAFSGHVLGSILDLAITSASNALLYGTQTTVKVILSYLSGLFAYRRSLRFKDYFTGSHSQPLAVADASFDASNTSVIDITKNIQKQRFLNAVNRVGARLEDYMQEIFGSKLAPDYTKPFYLGHTSDVIFGAEVENTGEAQQTNENSITSNLRSNGSRYEFSFEPDRDCIVIGLTYFDIARSYSKTIDRQTMHLDRFDWFNPYMQFIGDQPIYFNELNPDVSQTPSADQAFSYEFRHMEYKQRFNVVAGGFVTALPGWAFIADQKFSWDSSITPDFIRSLNSELDRFYQSLTGYSLGTYFHFIVKNVNDCTASRPMAYSPSIL